MRTPLLVIVSLVSLLSLLARPVLAQAEDPAEKKSLEHYQKGVTAYDLGKFDEAIAAFEAAYELKPQPAYLYNIAQAYRQKGDASRAVFFYRRYLQKSPDAKNRDVVEKRIAELEELAKKQEESKARPPNSLEDERPEPPPAEPEANVAAMTPPAPAPTSAEPPAEDVGVAASASEAASGARLALEAGTAFVSLGDGPSVPVQVSLRAGGAYCLPIGSSMLDLGGALTLVPVPFETLDRASSGTAMMVGLLANAGVRLPLAASLSGRGELGAGVVLMTGLAAMNPFTEGGAESSLLVMPTVRAAAGLDYAVARNLALTLTPALAWTAAASDLDPRISSILRVDVLLGVAYTL